MIHRATQVGAQTVAAELRQSIFGVPLSLPVPVPVSTGPPETSANAAIPAIAEVEAAPHRSYPPTRPASPREGEHQPQQFEPSSTSEWHEQKAGTALDGMGATSTDDWTGLPSSSTGSGYIGLSSSATLLHAIRRLAPSSVNRSPLDSWLMYAFNDAPAPVPPVAAPMPSRLPPAHATRSLIESYFTYFRECTQDIADETPLLQSYTNPLSERSSWALCHYPNTAAHGCFTT